LPTSIDLLPSSVATKVFFLLENWYGEDSEVCKLFILKGLSQAVEGLDVERAKKSDQFNNAIKIIAVAFTLIAIAALIAS